MGKRRIKPGTADAPIDTLLGRPVEGETDLHGLDARSAEGRLEMFVSRWATTRPGAVIRVITGKGNRSEGAAVLKPLVEDLLRGKLSGHIQRFRLDVGGGSYLIETRP